MVKVILQKCPLFLVICKQCNALLTFQFEDVHNSQIICPVCNNKVLTRVMDMYNGVVRREGEVEKNE